MAYSARYVLGCHRYIERNPVEAGMVNHPGLYTWSSYRANALGKDDRLVSPHPEYLALGLDSSAQRNAYRGLFDTALDPELIEAIRAGTRGGYPMGSDPSRKTGV